MRKRFGLDNPEPAAEGPRIGFFGLLGSGNLGNDGSFEAVLTRVRELSKCHSRRNVYGSGSDESAIRRFPGDSPQLVHHA